LLREEPGKEAGQQIEINAFADLFVRLEASKMAISQINEYPCMWPHNLISKEQARIGFSRKKGYQEEGWMASESSEG
jgi:hypothetical protein